MKQQLVSRGARHWEEQHLILNVRTIYKKQRTHITWLQREGHELRKQGAGACITTEGDETRSTAIGLNS